MGSVLKRRNLGMESMVRRFTSICTAIFLCSILVLSASCISGSDGHYTIRLGGDPFEEDLFGKIRARASRSIRGSESGIEIRVLYAPGEEEIARQALQELKKPAEWLSEITDRRASSRVDIYLYPEPGSNSAFYLPHSDANLTGVLLFGSDRNPLGVEKSRNWYFTTYVHELAHDFLAGLRLRDGWLTEGLPEYLSLRYSRSFAPDAYWDAIAWTPPLVAVSKVEIVSWKVEEPKFLSLRDTELAYAEGVEVAWRYAAAGELISRWITRASEQGSDEPVAELLKEIERMPDGTGWAETRELAREHLGIAFEKLGRSSEEQVARAVAEAWEHRVHPDQSRRIHAMRVLSYFGFPPEARAAELICLIENESADLNPPDDSWPWAMVFSTAQALAKEGDAAVAVRAARIMEDRWPDDSHRLAPASFWKLVASKDPQSGREHLVEMLNESDINLYWRAEANEVLRELTGKDAGWSIHLSPADRIDAAERWRSLIPAQRE